MPSEVAPGPIHYRLLSEHFQVCLDLREPEREAYLSGPRVDDPSLREELRSLLSYHARAVAPRPVAARAARRGGHGRRIAALGALAALLVLGVRAWTLDRLDASLKEDGLRSLQRILELRRSSIRAWAERQKEAARSVLEDPAFVSHVAALAVEEEPRSSPSHAWVSARLARAPGGLAETGFRVVSPSGAVLCSGGRTGPAPPLRLSDVAVSRPYPDREDPDTVRPLMCVGGPIRGERVVAYGLFFVPPEREFYGLLAPEGPAELVAFDERSLLLNNLRDAGALRQAGLLSEDQTALRVHLRDPGRALTRPETPSDPWAPTRMCLAATRGTAGGDAAGYRNLLGRPVLGAWAWLPEHDMGLGVEEELDAVLAPARSVRTAFAAVLAVLAAFAGGAFLAGRVRRTDSPFGFYVLEGPLGQGGAGDVFLAHHSVLHRPAALKILREPRPGAAAVARFKREARMAGRLAHPNAIQIFEYAETSDGRLYYAMEYVDGLNVAQLVTLEGPLPVCRALYLLKQISGALEEAHGLGLVHRDLKPSNVMIGQRGGLGDVVKILDFGIASCVSGEPEDATRSAHLMGTPGYIAPECFRRPGHLDARSDIYSFGGVAFHILTGRSVFEGPGPAELIYQALASERPSPSKLRGEPLPAALERLILACLSLEPEARPSSMREITEALKAVETPDAWSQDEARAWWSANGEKAARLKSVSS